MKLLWFTWKDLSHPHAGGAEIVNEELAKRLVADGHDVIFIVAGYKGAVAQELHPDGYTVIRVGGRYSVYWKAFRYYRKHLKGWADKVIDEVNTMPFFTKYYVDAPTILFVHMLCRKIWFYQFRFPFSLVGYLAEPLYLRLVNNATTVTVSESTKQDLLRNGFDGNKIHIISEGIIIRPLPKLTAMSTKAQQPTLLSLGSIRPMKRTLDQLKAFELAKQQIPDLQLVVAGDSSGRYGSRVLSAIRNSPYTADITYVGRVTDKQKIVLLRSAHVLLQTSVKEGWGLTVTEAASQGTPAVVYNVDGLRDSVQNNQTGMITSNNTPQQLADALKDLLISSEDYNTIRTNAWRWSKQVTFDKSYIELCHILMI